MKELEQIKNILFENTDIREIILDPKPASSIYETRRESILTSALFKCDVEFTHNVNTYGVIFSDLMNSVKKIRRRNEKIPE